MTVGTNDIPDYGDAPVPSRRLEDAIEYVSLSLRAHLAVIDGLEMERCLIVPSAEKNGKLYRLNVRVQAHDPADLSPQRSLP